MNPCHYAAPSVNAVTVSKSPGEGMPDASGPGHVPNAGCVFGVRAGDDPGPGECGAGAALAHAIRGLGGVYSHADYREQRAKMLGAWADHLDALMNKATVIRATLRKSA
jgi:hypothetical protein